MNTASSVSSNQVKLSISAIGLLLLLIFAHTWLIFFYLERFNSLETAPLNDRNYALFSLTIQASKDLSAKEFADYLTMLTGSGLHINKYDINFSLSSEPEWRDKIATDAWPASAGKLLNKPLPSIALSYQLADGRWLNYSVTVSTTFYVVSGFLLFAEILIISAIIFYFWSISRFTIPLRNFKASAERLGIDLLSQPVHAYGPGVVREAANAINEMQKRIQDLLANRTKMLASISHDLRTPITRLKLRAQFIDDPTQAKKIIENLDEMESLIASFLSYSKDHKHTEKKVNLDINSLLASICDDFADMEHNVTYQGDDKRLAFFGRPLELKRAFSNLIGNALKYATACTVTLVQLTEQLVIFIDDNGPGIPEAEINKVFQAFYRSESTYTAKSTGTGLGLTIAYEIIQAHGGDITLQNRPEGGLRVAVVLPKTFVA